jgi:quinolinate synthase
MSYQDDLVAQISGLKREKKAVIVAHNYQTDEIQAIADVVGDSFTLSKYCAANDARVIVFCGVRFMAESAKILSPAKTVLLPEPDAGCPMADMVTVAALRKAKNKYPQAAVVCYINSPAEVKAESDICCTSSNAVEVVNSVKQRDILFVPDLNLGHFVSKTIPEKNIIFWHGFCPTHHQIEAEEALQMKRSYPNALLLAHPECRESIVKIVDFVGSTQQIIDFASGSDDQEFIIGTERGVLCALAKANPGKKFYMMTRGLLCPDMKKVTLKSVYDSLNDMQYQIELDQIVITGARRALDKMLAVN